MRCGAIGLIALLAGCSSPPVLDERAVATATGRVHDLSLLALEAGRMALGWRDSAHPNAADARAAFLLLGSSGNPRGALARDDNPSEAASPLVATNTTILRVLAERREADSWGLVAVVRDPETGERVADGYRTLPVFAGARLTDLELVKTTSGALLAWVERSGGELPADFVQLVPLDDDANPLGTPLSLGQLPSEVVAIDLQPWDGGQQAILAALARRSGSAQIFLFRFDLEDGLRFIPPAQQLGTDLSDEDRVLQLEAFDDCLELLVTEGGLPMDLTFEPVPPPLITSVTSLRALPAGIAPRLVRASGTRILYVYDRPDGTTYTSFLDRAEPPAGADRCFARIGAERSFPLSSHRCEELATSPGDKLRYACASACLTEGCGDEWIWVGKADL